MGIKIRNLDVTTVKKIDELAKAKKMSRNEFLKIQIENLALLDVTKDERNRFEDSLQMVTEVLIKMMGMIQEQQKEFLNMKAMFILVMDIDEDEMEELLMTFNVKEINNVGDYK